MSETMDMRRAKISMPQMETQRPMKQPEGSSGL